MENSYTAHLECRLHLILTTPSLLPSSSSVLLLFLPSVHRSFSVCSALLSLIISHPPLITLSPRCECIYNVEHVHFKLISPTSLSLPPLDGYCDRPLYVCMCVSARARHEHTGCHRANICQGDLARQSWHTCVCVCCQDRACCCFLR